MVTVQLIHWNAEEATERATRFDSKLYKVRAKVPDGPKFFKGLQQHPPDVIVIDLSRLPSSGRDVGLTLRKTAATRYIPLIFVGGDLRKVQTIRSLLPDAGYATWDALPNVLEETLANPPENPIVPESVFAAYKGRPLAQKLGIKANMQVMLKNAPPGFEETVGVVPEGVTFSQGYNTRTHLIIWFVETAGELREGILEMADRAERCRLWIAWPKKASGKPTDLSQQAVREAGLAARLVDYKICSIDDTWSGLLFTDQKPGP